MQELPDELIYAIAQHCNLVDLQSIALVSRQWNRVAFDLRKGLYCINELEEQSLWYNYSLCHYIAHPTMSGRIRTTFTHRPWSTAQRASGCPLQVSQDDIVLCAAAANIDILNRLHD